MKVELIAATYPKSTYSAWGALFYTLEGGEGHTYGHVGLRFSELTDADKAHIKTIGDTVAFDMLNIRRPMFVTWGSKAVLEAWTMRTCLYTYKLRLDKEETRLAFEHAKWFVDNGYPYSNISYLNACCPGVCNLGCFACGGACTTCQCIGIQSGHCVSLIYMVLANARVRRNVGNPIVHLEDAHAALPLTHPRLVGALGCYGCCDVPPAAFSPLDLIKSLQEANITEGIEYERTDCTAVVPLLAIRL